MVREIQGCFSKLHVKTSYYGLIYRRKQLFFFCGWTWFFFRNFLCAHLCIWFSKFMCFLIDGAIVLWFIWGKNTGAIIRIQWQYEENLCAHIMCTHHTRIHVCTMKKKQSLFLCAHPCAHGWIWCLPVDSAIVLWFIWAKDTGAIIRIWWQCEENLCAHMCTLVCICTHVHTSVHMHTCVHMIESDVCWLIVRLFYGLFDVRTQGQSSEFDDNARKIYVHTCAH